MKIKRGGWYYYQPHNAKEEIERVKCLGVIEEVKVIVQRPWKRRSSVVSAEHIVSRAEHPNFFIRLYEKFFGDDDEKISINSKNSKS
jgi:hypothetical protein